MSNEPALQVIDLTKKYDGATVLDNINLSVGKGERIGLIGPNGAGKTTLANLIIGRTLPTRGRIIYNKVEITRLPIHLRARLGIAYTVQGIGLFRTLTIRENIELAMRASKNKKCSRTLDESAVMSLLEQSGIARHLDDNPTILSPGHQRILEVAMAALTNSSLLILDEPTQGLGQQDAELIYHMVNKLGKEVTLIIIEHNLDFVLKVAKRIIVLDKGKILAEGEPSEIMSSELVQKVYLGR